MREGTVSNEDISIVLDKNGTLHLRLLEVELVPPEVIRVVVTVQLVLCIIPLIVAIWLAYNHHLIFTIGSLSLKIQKIKGKLSKRQELEKRRFIFALKERI